MGYHQMFSLVFQMLFFFCLVFFLQLRVCIHFTKEKCVIEIQP